MPVEGVLDVRRRVVDTPQQRVVGLVLGEQRPAVSGAIEMIAAEHRMLRPHRPAGARRGIDGGHPRPLRVVAPRIIPRPGISEPERRQQVDLGGVRAAILGVDAAEDLIGSGLGVKHLDIPEAHVVKGAGVNQLVGRLVPSEAGVFGQQLRVRKGPLRILVDKVQPAMAWCRIAIEIRLLHVLAAIALAAGQAEGALLQKRVAAVPQRQRETQVLAFVADAAQPILVPTIGPRARLLVAESVPRLAIGAVVLAYRAPGALCQIRPPHTPVRLTLTLLFQTLAFRVRLGDLSWCCRLGFE